MLRRDRMIEDILADPMIRVVMKADRIDAREMARLLGDVSRRLELSRWDISITAASAGHGTPGQSQPW